jgi:hypothetical protein
MKGEVGGERRKNTIIVFLWQFMAFFILIRRPICGFLLFLMNEFLFPFVSLIDFRNNFSSLLHISTEMNGSKRMKKKLMKFAAEERDYGQEK